MLNTYQTWNCPVCNSEIKVNVAENDPDFFFYQIKKMGAMRYTQDYAFCSKEHMVKWLGGKRNCT